MRRQVRFLANVVQTMGAVQTTVTVQTIDAFRQLPRFRQLARFRQLRFAPVRARVVRLCGALHGGVFDVFSPAQSADGYDVIETVARQSWAL